MSRLAHLSRKIAADVGTNTQRALQRYKASRIKAADAWQLYSTGMTAAQVGKWLGCSGDTVRRRLKAAGYPVRTHAKRKRFCAYGKPAIANRRHCQFHSELARAKAAREPYRRLNNLPADRWRLHVA